MDDKYIMLSPVPAFLKEITKFENETDFLNRVYSIGNV
jgi:hypothetical protein